MFTREYSGTKKNNNKEYKTNLVQFCLILKDSLLVTLFHQCKLMYLGRLYCVHNTYQIMYFRLNRMEWGKEKLEIFWVGIMNFISGV